MSEVIVKRAIDRSKFPKTMLYVDKHGNICKADRPQPLSAEDKASRQEARDAKYHAYVTNKGKLRSVMQKAKKQARKEPTVANAEALEEAVKAYNDFKQTNWRELSAFKH